jgi:hypothetical protein
MANPLLDLVKAGRIADEAALKSAFRGLAKRLHPDLASPTAGAGAGPGRGGRRAAESFILLRSEYEEARAWLSRGGPEGAEARTHGSLAPRPWDRRDFYLAFQDLLARGFPRIPGRPWPNGPLAGYEDSRLQVMGFLAARDRQAPKERALPAFLAFEEGWLGLALSDPACLSKEVRISVGLRNLLLNIVGYHVSGTSQALRYSRNEWRRLETELKARELPGPLAFLALLMADLSTGPACVEED